MGEAMKRIHERTCGMPAAPMLAAVAVIEIAMICPMDSAIPFTCRIITMRGVVAIKAAQQMVNKIPQMCLVI